MENIDGGETVIELDGVEQHGSAVDLDDVAEMQIAVTVADIATLGTRLKQEGKRGERIAAAAIDDCQHIGQAGVAGSCCTGDYVTLAGQAGVKAYRIVGLQLCDRPPQPRTWMDRVMPGDGTIDLPALVAAVATASPDAWWELEVFSDDGSFGTDLPDSLWKLPARTLLERGRDAFASTWAEAHS
jgi:hypothetical protein